MNDLEDFGEESRSLREWLIGSEALQKRARAVKRRRMWRSVLERLHLRRPKTANEHPQCTDARCADCRKRVGVSGKYNEKGELKGDTKMKFDGWKTLIATLALAAGKFLESHYGFQIPASADVQFYVVLMLFLGLRFLTTGPIAFLKKK